MSARAVVRRARTSSSIVRAKHTESLSFPTARDHHDDVPAARRACSQRAKKVPRAGDSVRRVLGHIGRGGSVRSRTPSQIMELLRAAARQELRNTTSSRAHPCRRRRDRRHLLRPRRDLSANDGPPISEPPLSSRNIFACSWDPLFGVSATACASVVSGARKRTKTRCA